MAHFLTDMSNRVEHQKRNKPAIEKWPFGFVFGVQLGLRQARALIKTKKNKLLQVEQLWDKWGAFTAGPRVNAPHMSHNCSTFNNLFFLLLISVCVSAEGRVEHQKRNQTVTSQWPVGFVFGVQLDYSYRLKSVPSDVENRVEKKIEENQRDPSSYFSFRWNTFWSTLVILLNTKNETNRPMRNGCLVSFLVFNSAFGKHGHWLKPRLYR